MANKKIQATATLFLDTKDAQNDAKTFVNDLKQKLSEVETAADKMTVFKDMVAYIAQVDRALAALRKNNQDAFNSMFDGLDINLKQQLEGLFGVNGAQLGQVDALREKLNTLTLKSSIKEIRTFAKEINTLFTSIGVSAPFDNINEQFSGRTNTGHIQALATSLANFATVWEDLSARVSQGFGGAGGSGSGVFGGLNNEVQEEIDKLKKQKEEYQQVIDAINKKPIKINITTENDAEELEKLINAYREIQKKTTSSDFTNLSFEEQNKLLAERVRLATLLKNTSDHIIDNDGSEDAFTMATTGEGMRAIESAEAFLDDFASKMQSKSDQIQKIYKDLIAGIEVELNQLSIDGFNIEPTRASITSAVKMMTEANRIMGELDYDSPNMDLLDDQLDSIINKIKTLATTEEQVLQLDELLGENRDAPEDILDELCNILSVNIPKSAEKAKDAIDNIAGDNNQPSKQNISILAKQLQEIYNISRQIGDNEIGFAVDIDGAAYFVQSADHMVKVADEASVAVRALNENLTILGHTHPNGGGLFSAGDYRSAISQKRSGMNMPVVAVGSNAASLLNLDGVDENTLDQIERVLDRFKDSDDAVGPSVVKELQNILSSNGFIDALQVVDISNGMDELSEALLKLSMNATEVQTPLQKLQSLIQYYSGNKLGANNISQFADEWKEFESGAKSAAEVFDSVMYKLDATDLEGNYFKTSEKEYENLSTSLNMIKPSVETATTAMTEAENKLKSFLEFADKMQHENLYGSSENNVDIGRYIERLETAKTELEALGAQGLITAEDLEKVNLAFAEATSHLESETSHYDSYYNEPSYDYYDEYKEQQERAESAEGENTRLQRQLDTMRQLSNLDKQIGLTYDNNIDELDGLIEERKTLLDMAENANSLSEEDLQTQRAITREYEERAKFIHEGYDAAEKDLQKNLEHLSFENMGELSLKDIDGYIDRLNVAYSKLEEAFNNNLMGDADTFYENIEGPYLRAIAELEIEKERFQKENNYPQQKDVVDSNEVIQLETLHQKLLEVKDAVDAKTQAFEEEYVTVDSVVDAEITSLQSLIAQLQEVVTQINLINAGFNNINTNAPKVELKSAPVEQSSATENIHYVTDPQGRPVTMYRGIRNSYSGLVSNRYHGGTFSTDNLELAKEYAGELGKVEKVLLSMKNPLEIDGRGALWNQIEYIGDNSDEASQKLYELNASIRATKKLLADAENIPVSDQESKNILRGFITEEDTKRAKEISYWTKELKKYQEEKAAILADTSNPYGKKNTNELVEIAKSKGYDGVIFKNIIDSATGDVKDLSNVMVTFEQDQIHYIETIASTFESSITELKNHFGGLTKHISASGDEVEASIRKMVELRGKLNAGEISEDEYNAFISGNAIARDYKKLAKRSMAVPDFITGALDGDEFDLKHVIQMINDMLDNMRHRVQKVAKAFGKEGMPLDQLLIDNTNVAPITESPAYEENAVDEVEQLNKLQTVLTEVKNAILAKTKAFVDEGDVVGQVVGKEVSALNKLLETINEIVPKVDSLSTKMAGIGPIDFVTKTDVDNTGTTKPSTTTEDKFQTRVDAKKGAITKYINDLKDVQYVTDDTRDELIGLRDALDTVKTPKDLNDIIAKFEKLQTEVGILKASFEKTGLNDIQNVERSLLGSFNTLDIDQKRELEPERDEVIKQLETYKNAVLNGQKVELQAIEDTVRALREKIEVYKQANKEVNNAEAAQKKNSKFGDTVSRNATAKYNSLMGSVNSDQFENSKEVAAIVGEYEKAYKAMIAFRNELRNSDGAVSETDEVEFKRLTTECNEYAKALDKLIKSTMKLKGNKANPNDYMLGSDFVDNAQGRKQALTDFVKSVYDIDVAAEDFRKDWNEVVFAVDNGDGTFTQMTARLTDARNEIIALAGDTKKVQSKLESFVDGLKNRLQSLSQYFIATVGIYDVWNVIKQGIQYVRDIDNALTELRKVTNETEASYAQFLQTASKTASMVGSTVSDFVNATADFARLGYDLNQASQLAEAASVYKNVGDGIDDISQASESIISTMKAFGIEANNAMGIVDRFNEVGNNFAISSTGIGEAMQRSASALYEAGNTIDESIALITGANSVIQNPEQVGTALKTLALRLRGAKVELEEAGEDVDGMAESTSQLQEKLLALTHGKVDIMLDENTFKNTTQILREMSAAWEHMTDIERASALELMGGKRQANILSSVIKNFDTVEDVITTSMDSAGSALRENEKYLESIQGRIDIFNNSVQTMWMNLIDSNMVKGVVDIGTFLVKQLDTLHGKIILIGTALAGLKIHDIMKTTGKGFTAVFNELFDIVVEKIKTLPNMIQSIVPATQNVIKSMKLIANATSGVVKADIGRAAASAGVSNQLTRQIIAEAGLKGVTTALTAEQIKATAATLHAKFAAGELTAAQYLTMMSTMGLKTAFKALCDVLKLNPFYAIAAVIAGAAWALDKFTTTAQEAADTAKKAFDEIQSVVDSTKSTIQSLETELSTLNDKIEELTGKELSFADNEELEKLKAQREELEHSLKVQEQLLQLQKDTSNKQAVASMKAYTKAASEGAKETQDTAKNVGTISGALAGAAITLGVLLAVPTGGTSLAATLGLSGTAVAGSAAAMGAAGGYFGNKLGESVGSGIASNEGTYDAWYETYTKALDAARKDEQEALEKYQKDSSNIDKLDKWQEAQQRTSEIEKEMYDHLSQMQQYMNSLEYGVSDEIDAELDTWNNFLDKFSIDQGASGSEVTALDRIFGENASEEIQVIKEQILEAVKTGKDFDFTSAINGSQELKDTLDYVGLSAEDVKNYFTQIGEAASNVSVKEITPVATYSDLLEDAEAYKEILLQTSEIIVDNTKVTEDYKDGLIALVGSEAEVNKYFDKTNKLVVKDAKGLNTLVQATKKNVAANASLAKSQARLQYYQLFKKMQACVSAKGVMFNATKSEVLALYQEMNALEKTIAQYSRLEAQLLDTGNAYDQFEKAQEIDSATDYMSSVESWITALHEGFSDGKLGTETVQVAVEGLIHESVIEGLTTAEEKMAAIHHYATQGKLAEYFDIQFNEDGTLESAEMKLGNMRKFIEDGLANGAFVGSDWMHFDLSDDIDSIEDLADKYQLTKEIIFAAIEEIEDHDIEWLNGDYSSIFEDILPDNLANDIYENTSALADLAAQLANGEITAEQYTAKWSELNKVSQENAQKARENASAWIETSNDLELAQSKVQKLSNELEALQQQGASETDIRLKTVELDIAKQDLSNIAEKLSALETMDPVVLQVAMEQAQEEINDFKENNETLLTKVDIEQDDKTGEFEYKAKVVLSDNEKKKLEEYIQDLNDEYLFRTTLGEEPLTAEEHLSSIESITQNILDVVSGNKNKTTNTTGDTEENIAKLSEQIKAAGDLYNQLTNGNVDYNKRPMVSPETMRQYYPEFDGDIATTYSQYHTIGEGEALYTIDITPILEDGTVLSQDALDEYVQSLVTTDGMDGLLESDTNKLIINAQPGDYDEEYWDNYQKKLGEVKDIHWELVQQLQNAKLQTNVGDLQSQAPEDGGSSNFKEFFATTIPEKWDELWNNVGAFLDGLGEEANVLKEKLVSFFKDTVMKFVTETIPNAFTNAFDIVANFFTETIPDAMEDVKTSISEFFATTLPEAWNDFWTGLSDGVLDLIDSASNGLDKFSKALDNFLDNTLPEAWNNFWDSVGDFVFETIPYTIGYIEGASERFWQETVPQAWDTFVENAKAGWNDLVESAKTFVSNTIDSIKNSISNTVESAKQVIEDLIQSIDTFVYETWPSIRDSALEHWTNLKKSIIDAFADIVNGVEEFITITLPEVGRNIKQYFSNLFETAKAEVDKMIVGILGFINVTVPTKIEEMKTSIGDFLSGIVSSVGSFMSNVLTWIPNKIAEIWDSFTAGFGAGRSGGGYTPTSGRQRVNGTAHASGTAHQSGDWGLPKSEHNSLVGELGTELVWKIAR